MTEDKNDLFQNKKGSLKMILGCPFYFGKGQPKIIFSTSCMPTTAKNKELSCGCQHFTQRKPKDNNGLAN